jgi:hypothetical protein
MKVVDLTRNNAQNSMFLFLLQTENATKKFLLLIMLCATLPLSAKLKLVRRLFNKFQQYKG